MSLWASWFFFQQPVRKTVGAPTRKRWFHTVPIPFYQGQFVETLGSVRKCGFRQHAKAFTESERSQTQSRMLTKLAPGSQTTRPSRPKVENQNESKQILTPPCSSFKVAGYKNFLIFMNLCFVLYVQRQLRQCQSMKWAQYMSESCVGG